MSERPTFRPYTDYQQRQRNLLTHKDEFGPKLFKQMVVGFLCAGLLGLIFLILGAVFMKEALKSEYSISVMLCVFGMVAGLIIIVGTAILGKLSISRKWLKASPAPRNSQCFQTCSVVYTPSQDPIAIHEAPPSYDTIMLSEFVPGTVLETSPAGMLPPKYCDVASLPNYGEPV
ncbi:uncharacterized protein LOC133189756 [Saccostrea echinata]|uniref:uncharacterized protein LOC133189756 n=1 Tax=Saccostrea echinata TaxID=191078 RepID=UPI002A83279E|nr:uncharacterized protein LOC133189756 [Saccostrea echinata]